MHRQGRRAPERGRNEANLQCSFHLAFLSWPALHGLLFVDVCFLVSPPASTAKILLAIATLHLFRIIPGLHFGSDPLECAAKDLEAYSSAWQAGETLSADDCFFSQSQLVSANYLSAVLERLQSNCFFFVPSSRFSGCHLFRITPQQPTRSIYSCGISRRNGSPKIIFVAISETRNKRSSPCSPFFSFYQKG